MKNDYQEVKKIEDQLLKNEGIDVKDRGNIQEVEEREVWEDKRELLEPTLNHRNQRKILFTDFHDHFIDFKCNILIVFSTYIISS